MPTAAQRLHDRRTALGLPDTLTAADGTEVPVTGDLCTWIETVALGACAPWDVSLSTSAHSHRGPIRLRIGPPNAPAIRVWFDKRGRWTTTSSDRGRHLGGGYWNRSREAGQLPSATEFYRDDARREWYTHALALPEPPDWAIRHDASLTSQERARREKEAAQREQNLREHAVREATAALRARHAEEYAELLEQHYLMAALEHGRPMLDALVTV